ncbi:MAG: HAD family phosphatase [Acidimicrobiia bacterium]
MITTVIFDYGGVISGPLFVGIGAFEKAEGFAPGSLLQLLFGETHYIGVEGRAVAEAIAADPDAAEASGEVTDEPDWHLLEKGAIEVKTYFERMVEKAPAVLGKPLDMDAYGRFWRSNSPSVHWMVVHKMRDLKAQGLRIAILTNNVKEFGEHWRATFPIDELVEDVVDSSHVGVRKPEREIYELTCTRLGIEPSEAVFLDDNADNVAGARAFGLETVHFGVDPWAALAELDAILTSRGIAPRRH